MPAEATREQFALLRTYLDSRHPGGGMSDMGLFDYVAMVEETPVNTHIVEYRRPDEDGKPGALVACALTDVLRDGLSMVYSFFHPGEDARSLGTYMILDHVDARQGARPALCLSGLLGARLATRWITRSRFAPLEALGPNGWERLKVGLGRFTSTSYSSPMAVRTRLQQHFVVIGQAAQISCEPVRQQQRVAFRHRDIDQAIFRQPHLHQRHQRVRDRAICFQASGVEGST